MKCDWQRMAKELLEKTKIRLSELDNGSRWLALGLVGFAVLCLYWAIASMDSHSQSFILGELSDDELRLAEAAFATAMLNDAEIVGSRIRVPSLEKAKYLNALQENGAYPKAWGEKRAETLDGGLFDSAATRGLRYELGRERNFEELLRRRPQIDFAAVEFDESKTSFGQPPLRTCCIQVSNARRLPVDHSIMQNIAETATTYFAGLDRNNVSVVDLNTSYTFRFEDHAVSNNPLLAAKQSWESHYQDKILRQLSTYGNIRVMVDVDLDPTITQKSAKLLFDPNNSRAETTKRITTIEKTPARTADAEMYDGVEVQPASGLNRPAAVTTTESEETNSIEFGREEVITQSAGFVPRSLHISIGVPESYYYRLHESRLGQAGSHVSEAGTRVGEAGTRLGRDGIRFAELPQKTPSPEDISSLEEQVHHAIRLAVTAIVGKSKDIDDLKHIEVYSFVDFAHAVGPTDDTGPVVESLEPAAYLSSTKELRVWLADRWETLALLTIVSACVIASFLWIRNNFAIPRSDPRFAVANRNSVTTAESGSARQADPTSETQLYENALPDGMASQAFAEDRRETPNGLKEDLSEFIKSNADDTKRILQKWIREAA
jgi:hypothetical protein